MVFNENGEILNEGLFQKIKGKFSKKKDDDIKETTISGDELKKLKENIQKIRSIVTKSFSKNIKIVEQEYSNKLKLKSSLSNAFKIYKGETEDEINISDEFTFNKYTLIVFFEGDIFQLKNAREDDGTFFNAGKKLCLLINEDLQKMYPTLKIEYDDSGDWDDYDYGIYLSKLYEL